MSVSDRPRHLRLSRFDPTNWPPGTGIALFIGWATYAVVSTLWIPPLLWTVLPIGLTLYLFAERYSWRVNLVLVVPLALLTASAQVVASSTDAPTVVAFGIYLVACSYFSTVLFVADRDRWIAHLPGWLLGERFASRLAWIRFEESLVAANAIVRQVGTADDQGKRQAEMSRLATQARTESKGGGAWQEAWIALAEWLDALIEIAGTEPTSEQVRHVHRLLGALDEANMRAVEQTSALDPVLGTMVGPAVQQPPPKVGEPLPDPPSANASSDEPSDERNTT